ncbi:Alpha/Beta hydrolase protein [Hypoxylon sp. NC1633]|nr:Alpha/Beta hydrolase protein [Hypoxylon sp. NC1633]
MGQPALPAVLVAGLAAVAAARNCKNITVPVSISAQNANLTLAVPQDNIEVNNIILDIAQPGVNFTALELSPDDQFVTVEGTYSIAATYCEPDAGPGHALQVLTHGVGWDRSYWDFAAQDYKYSYVNAALARNYSTFAYDRLVISSPAQKRTLDPINEVQSELEVASLAALTTLLRDGTAPGVAARYDKVVHVGHSYGSIQTWALTATRPQLSDGIVLTGWSDAFSAGFLFGGNYIEARTASQRLADYPPGYLASEDVLGCQTNFFAPGNFDREILEAAFEATQPVTVGELMTIASVTGGSNGFPGPVLVITGDRDVPFCAGNCQTSDPSIPAQSKETFTNPSYFEAVVVPGAGHGLNLEFTAQQTYTSILDFFDKNI